MRVSHCRRVRGREGDPSTFGSDVIGADDAHSALAGPAAYVPLRETLVSDQRTEMQIEQVLTISGLLHRRLHADGILSGEGDSPYLLPLLNAHIELHNKANPP